MSEPRQRLSKIPREHVERACRELARTGARGGGSYFVTFEGSELPAKRVLREAYRLAYGEEIAAGTFSGGAYTAQILSALGFKVIVRETSR